MPKKLQPYLSYLAKCYVSDNRQLKLTNFLNPRKIEHLLPMEQSEELINDHSPKIPLPEVYAINTLKNIQLFEKEKELIYGSLFILGETTSLGKTEKACAPLLLFPARIEHSGEEYYLSLDLENFRINESAIDLLAEEAISDDFKANLIKNLPTAPFAYGAIGRISRLLQKQFNNLNTEPLLLFPELWSMAKVKRQLQPKQLAKLNGYSIIPASALGVVKKSADTYGILSELDELSMSERFSKPIQAIFGEPVANEKKSFPLISLPAVLNESQLEAIHNARSETLSMIIGPPGTGKSFTIACIALDHLMRGESVLISSKQNEAVSVVANKITELLGTDELLIRGGTKYHRKMSKHLRKILRKKQGRRMKIAVASAHSFHLLSKEIAQLEKTIQNRLIQEIDWSVQLTGKGISKQLKALVIKTIHGWYTPHWELTEELNNKLNTRIDLCKKLIIRKYHRTIDKHLISHRYTFERLLQGLTVSASSQRDALYEQLDLKTLLSTFPIWLCRLSDIYRIIPMKEELYDVVIIDEASQSDMASVLPAMQRAKRAVVVGDPNQLRHVSFLSVAKMSQLLTNAGLKTTEIANFNYREKSFLDLLSSGLKSQNQVSFLDEHYRSVPEIIHFSNKEFYSNSLRVMTERPLRNKNHGNFIISTNGKRTSDGANHKEAALILEKINEIIVQEAELNSGLKSSIGILSPLRNQVDYLSKQLAKAFSIETIQAHHISVGTAYSFQGEERDIMLLSFAVDNESHSSAFVHINKPDVFNVSITRAKNKQFVYHSIDPKLLKTDHYLRMFLEENLDPDPHHNPDIESNHDLFMNEVIKLLNKQKLKHWIYFSIAGVFIDILVKTEQGIIGIDLIGYPGTYEDALTVERYKILNRAGISILPLPYSYWLLQREDCEKKLVKFIHQTT
jgi:superfamily I DNA/RNA helicase